MWNTLSSFSNHPYSCLGSATNTRSYCGGEAVTSTWSTAEKWVEIAVYEKNLLIPVCLYHATHSLIRLRKLRGWGILFQISLGHPLLVITKMFAFQEKEEVHSVVAWNEVVCTPLTFFEFWEEVFTEDVQCHQYKEPTQKYCHAHDHQENGLFWPHVSFVDFLAWFSQENVSIPQKGKHLSLRRVSFENCAGHLQAVFEILIWSELL